jgi:hypothetical protein
LQIPGRPALSLQAETQEQPLVNKVAARIPGWKGQLLNAAGRTALTKATMSAIPIHMSIALCLSPWAIDTIDRLHRAFIWAGTDMGAGGRCKVAWVTVCRPKELGGLGISDLRRTGVALRVCWVWKDRRDGIAPRTKERAVLANFQAATVFSLGKASPLSSGQIGGSTVTVSSTWHPPYSRL